MGAQTSSEFDVAKEVQFTIHGELHSVKTTNKITPETSLNSYLRNNAGLHGTKGMCYEAGCGACIVAVTVQHPVTKITRTFAINSCMIPILSCHDWVINTIEGIGNSVDGYHPLQKTLAKHNGSQCGICSGGMVMNMYALCKSKEILTMKDIENSFGGNLCRCTGYRPIMDAFKAMAVDATSELKDKYPDIEDIKMCEKTGKQCLGSCTLKDLVMKPICLNFGDNSKWYKVYSIADILVFFKEIGDCTYRLVAGNTAKGVYPTETQPEYWADVQSVPELISHKLHKNLDLGGNVSLSDTMEIMLKVADENHNFWYLKKVYNHLDLVANVTVRNAGTIAGNLTLKHDHHEFPSDVFLLLETIGAKLDIVERTGLVVHKSLLEYLTFDMNKCILKTICIPPYNKDKYLFESYKICPRIQNAHAYVNAGFLIEHDGQLKVKSARIVFGGIHPKFVHAKELETYLVGKNLMDNATLQGGLEKLNEELKPDFVLPDASPKFRKELAMSLFYKFVLASVPKDKVNPKIQSGGTRLERGLSTGKQTYDINKDKFPVGEPIEKLEALIQCAGEAQYVNDMPAIPGELFAAFVLVNAKPLSKIKSVDKTEAMKMPGVRAYVDRKDVPGKNSFSPTRTSPTVEQLFVEDKVLYNGQPIGMIIATTYEQALEAAKKVKVEVTATEDKPYFNIEGVLKDNVESRITNVTDVKPTKKGDNVKHVIKGDFNIYGQYHFTMETQTCICIPTDDGCYDVHAATQFMDHVQESAAEALNLPMNKINVFVKRLGGAYGAKIIRASLVSTACVVAAAKMHKPVRLILPLVDNMKMLGKRIPTFGIYEVGVDNNGSIQYLDYTFYQDLGLSGYNEASTAIVQHFIKNGYTNDTWKLNGNMVQTDMPGNAYARAPASCEGVSMIETVMDHISAVVEKDPVEVRNINTVSNHPVLPGLVKDIVKSSEFDKRSNEITDFNSKNRWMKKGISLVQMEYVLEIAGPYSVFVSVYAGDGSVSISHGGIECGQGINTKVAQVCAYSLDIPLDQVSIKPSNCLNAPNNTATGGSVTSESVCYGTIQACKEILKRLQPVKDKMKNPTWKELVLQGFAENIEMCATAMYSTSSDVSNYLIYGVCVAEVEIDVLTGEHNVVRVDLLEDVGQSISPNIDFGQIEGAFIMGQGYFTCEKLIYSDTGELLTNRTWTYKVPGVKDIPVDLQVQFRQNSDNPVGVLNSKAVAEPPLCLSVAVPLAIRRALASARLDADAKAEKFVPMNGPTTVEYTYQNAMNDYKKYTL